MAPSKDRTGKKPAARKPVARKPAAKKPSDKDLADEVGDKFGRVVIPPQLEDPEARESWGMPRDPRSPCSYIVELNLLHASGLDGAAQGFFELYDSVIEGEKKKGTLRWRGREVRSHLPRRVGKTYFAALVPLAVLKKLVIQDGIRAEEMAKENQDSSHKRYRTIYRVWPDFKVKGLVDASVATIKADAAFRAFAAAGAGVVWAVIDSGVQGDHPHFAESEETIGSGGTLGGSVEELHRCFCEVPEEGSPESGSRVRLPDPDRVGGQHPLPSLSSGERRDLIRQHRLHALQDEYGHGTHVGGIIAGGLSKQMQPKDVVRLERRASVGPSGAIESRRVVSVQVPDPRVLRGVAPACRLVSLRVLDHKGEGLTSDVIRALEYIRESLNDDPKLLRVHGVNLSVGYEFDAEMFACGQSPICSEVDRLVRAGVVVVAAAGNTGYGTALAQARSTKVCLSNTINDPGNADLAITVGATHRESPHTYGVSYFSSKGPTGDGRLKPDLVAPGERITSCGAGRTLKAALGALEASTPPAPAAAHYLEDSGTSMAAPHVSGAIAAFLSIRREFISKPLQVKKIFLESATPLGRERYFEGHGLVDLMRAIQSV